MATKKFIIEVEEGYTSCEDGKCPIYGCYDCNQMAINCDHYNLATMKIKECESDSWDSNLSNSYREEGNTALR